MMLSKRPMRFFTQGLSRRDVPDRCTLLGSAARAARGRDARGEAPGRGDFWILKIAQGPASKARQALIPDLWESGAASVAASPMLDLVMSFRATPVWFAAALVPMVVSQIVRLEQSDPATWISWDYAGRVGALAVLGAIPSARNVAFRWAGLRMTYWQAA